MWRKVIVDAESRKRHYRLHRRVWTASNPEAQQLRVTQPSATVPKAPPGTVISVKAVNTKGLEGWDWVQRQTVK